MVAVLGRADVVSDVEVDGAEVLVDDLLGGEAPSASRAGKWPVSFMDQPHVFDDVALHAATSAANNRANDPTLVQVVPAVVTVKRPAVAITGPPALSTLRVPV